MTSRYRVGLVAGANRLALLELIAISYFTLERDRNERDVARVASTPCPAHRSLPAGVRQFVERDQVSPMLIVARSRSHVSDHTRTPETWYVESVAAQT